MARRARILTWNGTFPPSSGTSPRRQGSAVVRSKPNVRADRGSGI